MAAFDNHVINSKELSTTTRIEKKKDEILSPVDDTLLLNMLISLQGRGVSSRREQIS